MADSLKMVGLVRFSVLTPTYYSERFANLEETAAHLFDPDRMELRFSIFENLCLPSLLQQTDPDFDVVILTAEAMPEVYRNRLEALLAPHSNLHFRPVGTQKHYRLLRHGYNSVPYEGFSHRILFRLDDDDAVDLDFVRRTKALAAGILPLQPSGGSFVIAYNRGFYLRATPEGPEVFDAVELSPLSVGTSLVAPAASWANPYRYNHRKLASHFNIYSDVTVPAYIRTIHGDNKSDPTQTGETHKMDEAAIGAELHAHFGLTLDAMKAI